MKDERLPKTGRETAQSIDEAAAVWTARLDRGLTESEQTELEEWLSGDSRRMGALARARAIWAHADRARSLGALATEVPPPEPVWRRIDRRTVREVDVMDGAMQRGDVGGCARAESPGEY